MLCLLAGTTFWVLNALNKNYTTKINYPINFVIEDSDDLVTVKELPEKVEIDVSGGGWNLLRKTYWFNINPLNIPLNNPTQVKYILGGSLVPYISDQLSEISLNYVVTDTLFINIERKTSRMIPVVLDSSQLSVGSSFKIIGPIRIDPDSVLFTGPESQVKALPDSISLTIDREIQDNFNEEVGVNYNVSDLITFSPQNVRVAFEVAEFGRHNKVVDITPLNFPRDSSIVLVDDKVEVIYTVREDEADKVSESDFSIIANFNNLETADSTINATLGESPESISDLRVNPKKLRIRRVD